MAASILRQFVGSNFSKINSALNVSRTCVRTKSYSKNANRVLFPESIYSESSQERMPKIELPPDSAYTASVPENEKIEYEESTEDFKFVEALLPRPLIPEPPVHDSYPTPSGWYPPNPLPGLTYNVKRTRFHQIPLYYEHRMKKTVLFTQIKYIEGDIWALNDDLIAYLKTKTKRLVITQVHEIARQVKVRGDFLYDTAEFIKMKGF